MVLCIGMSVQGVGAQKGVTELTPWSTRDVMPMVKVFSEVFQGEVLFLHLPSYFFGLSTLLKR